MGFAVMTTVTAVKRALEECINANEPGTWSQIAFVHLANDPTALTILANRLSDRGEAGNDAATRHLDQLRDLLRSRHTTTRRDDAALQWAIDQLTPPEPAR